MCLWTPAGSFRDGLGMNSDMCRSIPATDVDNMGKSSRVGGKGAGGGGGDDAAGCEQKLWATLRRFASACRRRSDSTSRTPCCDGSVIMWTA